MMVISSDDGFSSWVFDQQNTLPETNIFAKNGWLEYYFPIGDAYFQGRTVSLREGKPTEKPKSCFSGFLCLCSTHDINIIQESI